MEWVTTRLRQWLQNGYVEIIELTGYADEDRQPGRTSCTQPFHRLSQLQDSHSQAQESCPSWTMQELPRIIQDRSRLHQGRKEAEVRNENRFYEYRTDSRHNTTVLAGAFRQFLVRVVINGNRFDLLGY